MLRRRLFNMIFFNINIRSQSYIALLMKMIYQSINISNFFINIYRMYTDLQYANVYYFFSWKYVYMMPGLVLIFYLVPNG